MKQIRNCFSVASLDVIKPHSNPSECQDKSSLNSNFRFNKGKHNKDRQKGNRKKCPVKEEDEAKYKINIGNIVEGKDHRTTLMIQNVPNKYTGKSLTSEINKTSRNKYDFFYLPIDFKNQCNVGYAFINFIHRAYILDFYHKYDSKRWINYNSEKV